MFVLCGVGNAGQDAGRCPGGDHTERETRDGALGGSAFLLREKSRRQSEAPVIRRMKPRRQRIF